MSGYALVEQHAHGVPNAPGPRLSGQVSPASIRILRGRGPVLAAQPLLSELARRTGQPGTADNLPYFLSLAASLRKTPYLILMSAAQPGGMAVSNTLSAAVLLFEYRLLGVGLRLFAPEDTTGRRCVLAEPGRRAQVAAQAAKALLARGAQIVFIACQHDERDQLAVPAIRSRMAQAGVRGLHDRLLWSVRQTELPTYLPLASSFAETLQPMGQKTKYNLKYYRRRAERELGCTFQPEASIPLEELLAFNRICSFPISEDEIRWRHNIFPTVRGGYLSGVRGRDGRWISLICGRRCDGIVEVDWQMNRDDLRPYSLSIMTRSYLIEHSVALGDRRLYMEGGTNHPIRRSFRDASVTEFTVVRQNLYARLVRRLAPIITPSWNRLAQIVSDPAVTWHSR